MQKLPRLVEPRSRVCDPAGDLGAALGPQKPDGFTCSEMQSRPFPGKFRCKLK